MTTVSDQARPKQTTLTLLRWAGEEAHNLPSMAHYGMLCYLCLHCFVSKNNAEGEPAGSVLFAYSYTESIMEGTGAKSRETVRKILNDLQDLGYIYREKRRGSAEGYYGGHIPHRIEVLRWCEQERQMIREGKTVPWLKSRPMAAPKREKARVLRMVRESDA